MISIGTLWLPILLSAVAVFIVSSLIHMFFGYHSTDFDKINSEDQVMDDLRKLNIPAGDYVVPFAKTKEERNTQEFKDKMNKGPVVFITMFPKGSVNMTQSFLMWFIYCIIVGIFAAYISGRAVGTGNDYLSVFRFAGCTAFVGYSLALMQNSIWYRKKWSATLKSMFDGLIYALVTAGIFGWLWPM